MKLGFRGEREREKLLIWKRRDELNETCGSNCDMRL
jgi:hypothetical protein